MSAQDWFNIACEDYDNCMGLIDEMSFLVRNSVKENFSADIAKREFDFILQTILFTTGCADGDFSRPERQFLDKITDRGDVLAYFTRKENLKPISWEVIQECGNTNDNLRIAAALLKSSKDYLDDFIDAFAFVDAVTDKDYLQILFKSLANICTCFGNVDGYFDENEKEMIKKGIMAMLVDPWLKKKAFFEAKVQESNTVNAPSKR